MDLLHDLEVESMAHAVLRRKLLDGAYADWGIEGKAPEFAVCLGACTVLPARDELRKHVRTDAIEGFSPIEQIGHPLVDSFDKDFALIFTEQVHPVEVLPGDERIPGFGAGDRVTRGRRGWAYTEKLAHVPRERERVAHIDGALHIPGRAHARHLEDMGQDGAVELLDLPVAAVLERPVELEAFGDHFGDLSLPRTGKPERHEFELIGDSLKQG